MLVLLSYLVGSFNSGFPRVGGGLSLSEAWKHPGVYDRWLYFLAHVLRILVVRLEGLDVVEFSGELVSEPFETIKAWNNPKIGAPHLNIDNQPVD